MYILKLNCKLSTIIYTTYKLYSSELQSFNRKITKKKLQVIENIIFRNVILPENYYNDIPYVPISSYMSY